tara:strand:- start:557 stop:1411 length:855 start_codon:yes stop_codon:yes gene_type:complete
MGKRDYRKVTQRKPKTKGKGDEFIDWTIQDLRDRWDRTSKKALTFKDQFLHGMDSTPSEVSQPQRKGIQNIPSIEERRKQEELEVQQALGQDAQGKTIDPVKQQYDSNVAMFRHNIESGYFSDQQIKSFAKSFYEFENTFDSKKYFDTDPEFNYVANNTEMARSADMLDKQNQLDTEETNLSTGEEGDIEGEKKATSKQNQLQPPDANDDTTSQIDPSYMEGDNSPGTVSAEQMKINKWFEDTANSPAAQAFKDGTEQQQTEWGKLRWQAKKNYDLFKKKNNRR